MLALSQRECKLGTKYSGKVVDQNGIERRTLKIELTDLPLDANELNALLGEPYAHRALYDTSRTGVRPILRALKTLELRSACESARVTLLWSLGAEQLVFTDAKLAKIRLELQEGGITAMSCTVETEPTLDGWLVALLERLGAGIEVEIHAEHFGAQQDLPLNRHADGEAPEAPRRGRRPTAH